MAPCVSCASDQYMKSESNSKRQVEIFFLFLKKRPTVKYNQIEFRKPKFRYQRASRQHNLPIVKQIVQNDAYFEAFGQAQQKDRLSFLDMDPCNMHTSCNDIKKERKRDKNATAKMETSERFTTKGILESSCVYWRTGTKDQNIESIIDIHNRKHINKSEQLFSEKLLYGHHHKNKEMLSRGQLHGPGSKYMMGNTSRVWEK